MGQKFLCVLESGVKRKSGRAAAADDDDSDDDDLTAKKGISLVIFWISLFLALNNLHHQFSGYCRFVSWNVLSQQKCDIYSVSVQKQDAYLHGDLEF